MIYEEALAMRIPIIKHNRKIRRRSIP